ncbi:amidase [Klebsiella oxytoca]|uniref:amidase n=1 Tax=Klebsiella oxytoca TaxID=571 RepID=UPI0029303F2C|nr:amidase family protein [Klebsiella oxytoca]
MFIKFCLYAFIILFIFPVSLTASAEEDGLNIIDMNLTQLRTALDKNEITSEELVKAYLSEIEKNNRRGKNINAVITINNAALNEARNWDKQHKAGTKSQPLAGIPFLAKDNMNTKGIITSGGSIALAKNIPNQNAFVVQKLLDEGAILLGKTNLSELAASYQWFGYSSFGGQTINPYNPLRNASGSSSGSAAAVAANFAPFALATDTSGSIREPAAVTNTVGFRPTFGLTSRSGVIPLSLTADVTGVITRNVMDQVIVIDEMKGEDKNDAATLFMPQFADHFTDGFTQFTLKGKIIAVLDNFDKGNPDVDRVKEEAINHLKSAGALVTHIRLPSTYEKLWETVLGPVGVAEFRPQFDSYLRLLADGQPKNSVEFMLSLKKLTEQGTIKINPARFKGLEETLNSRTTDSPEYIRILSKTIPSLRTQLTDIISKGKYSAIMFPTVSCPASSLPGKSDPEYVCKSADPSAASYIASTTGFPQVTVPAGMAAGNAPVGISFLGAPGADKQLLQLSFLFEQLINIPH